ncbi:MAG: polyphosphate polymerase domain-containing protein [Flexilinea sp.]
MNFKNNSTNTQEMTGTLTSLRGNAVQNTCTSVAEIKKLADKFESLSLKEMDGVKLLNRVDTKFVMPAGDFIRIFPTLQTDYRILSVHGHRLNHYRTIYFDSQDFSLYRMHVNGQAERYKVRSREYVDTQLSFLEVKHHTRKERTIKDRMKTSQPVLKMAASDESWLQGFFPYDPGTLEPKLWNTFTRITLVGRHTPERVTLDLDLCFAAESKTVHMDDLVVAEVKLDSNFSNSPFMDLMTTERLHPSGFSKYAMGVSMLYAQVKKNALKPKMRKLEKITGGFSYGYVY